MKRQVSIYRDVIMAGCLILAAPHAGAANEFDWLESTSLNPDKNLEFHFITNNSTLGPGYEFRGHFSKKLKFRALTNDYDAPIYQNKNNVQVSAQAKLRSNSLLFDWHPRGGNFRTTMGLMINDYSVTGFAYYDESYFFEGATISTDAVMGKLSSDEQALLNSYLNDYGYGDYSTLLEESYTIDPMQLGTQGLAHATANLKFPRYAPYFGFGWGNNNKYRQHFSYTLDVGVIFQGNPEVTELQLHGPVADYIRSYAPNELAAYEQSQKESLEKKLEEYKYLPTVSFGLHYRF